MKFENLYRLLVNEAEAIEDMNELSSDPTSQDMGDGDADMLASTSDQMSHDQKVEFLINNSSIIKNNKNLTRAEQEAKANFVIENGYFESIYDGVMQRKQTQEAEMGALEELPPALEDPNATPDDISDIEPALSDFKRQQKLEGEGDEEFSGQEI